MSIVFAAFVPHPPILIPNIGKENINQLKATAKAYGTLASTLRAALPQTLIVISPHGETLADAFTLNLSEKYETEFSEFGDFATKHKFLPDLGAAQELISALRPKFPLRPYTNSQLDHGSAIPLYLLAASLPDVRIVPLHYSFLPMRDQYLFGQTIKKWALLSLKRVAVIASGDLSHCLTDKAPGGYSSKGKKFDKRLLELLAAGKTEEIVGLDEQLINDAGECGLRSLVILLGVLDKIKCEPRQLAYEAPFGVGYLTMNFKL